MLPLLLLTLSITQPADNTWADLLDSPYDKATFAAHMQQIKQRPTLQFGERWYISGVYRARRKAKPPWFVVQIYNGDDRGFNFGCLVVLSSSGEHLRTIDRERVHWSLVAPDGDYDLAHETQKAKVIYDLPDLNGDWFADIPTQRWRPVKDGENASESTSIYLTTDDKVPCAFCLEFYNHWPAAGLKYGHLNLKYSRGKDKTLRLETPIYQETANGFTHTPVTRKMAEYKWDADKNTWTGPSEGPKKIWKILERD